MKRLFWIFILFALIVLICDAEQFRKCALNFSRNWREEMSSRQDASVSPCADFYGYACGNWYPPYNLRALGARDTLTTVKADNKLSLTRYFESIARDGNSLSATLSDRRQRLVAFYRSCENLPASDEKNASIQTYMDVLRTFSDFPIISRNFSEGSNSNLSFDWEFVSANMRRYGANSFWRTLVQPNWQIAEQLIFYIVPPSFDFLKPSKRNNFVKGNDGNSESDEDDAVFLYKTYIKYILLDIGVRVRKALKYADEIIEFERGLLALSTSNENSMVLRAPQSLQSLASEFPEIQLEKYFDVLLQDIKLPSNYKKNLLIAADKTYLRKLVKILRKTGNEIIGKYLVIQFLSHFELNLHDESLKERREHCLQQTNTFLANELSELYLDLKHGGNGLEFLRQAQQDLNEMFMNSKRHFEMLINATNVFDHDHGTRAASLTKLHAMQLQLPDLRWQSEENVSNIEEEFKMSEDYDLNLMKLYKLQSKREFIGINSSLAVDIRFADDTLSKENLKVINSQKTTNYGPLNVNAYYRLKKNSIEIPVGLLTPPIYDNCLEAPLIYGTIAYIVGHELLHGFDYDGLNYDQSGNIADVWDPKSIIAFGAKASCYLGSRYDDAHINFNENIADSEGLRLALGALEMIAGPLPATELKLFFISFAQIWCRASSEYTVHHTLHATHRERVNNVVGNFAEFAEIFNCKEISAMNPAEKCRIW